ncbi:type II toxin-antitoxin system RelE/ParE family toxin [Acinetobacter sp. WCHAc060033]|uniref:Type II toxin-antitoxin system RelE/ParE family toxin n=1 Tax=Acinetobacter wuhouensis TaxID=1879050 RepID=A0A3G2SZQ8_9GAMM|nr:MULTISPECIES: type II toxin-antitoxin system RelE/ParE family toxin [Acinetobacter]AYO53351.1 type II toxin-antitoxin system RelE/ParE family toxin [Acinetobacter wuhouensis]RZG87192.1 type II toxin-antitoxin system RelE/ParE family toxin [Acinetobacter sp. WCHAc060033]
MLTVNWKINAVHDLEEIIDYIFIQNPEAAINLEDEILNTAESLADMPYSGRIGRVSGTRERIVHPNYMIIYQVLFDSIEILNIVHTKKHYP